MALPSNLPPSLNSVESGDEVKSFFNNYFNATVSFPADQVDAVVGFFRKRGFDELASNSTSIVLLQQAKIDGVNVFQLLDTLTTLTGIQLSAVVTEVLNYNRQKISVLGYRRDDTGEYLEKRNVLI